MSAFKNMFQQKYFVLLFIILLPSNGNCSPPDWVPAENLQYNMNIIGVLELPNGSISYNGDDIIAGFVNDECRGIISPMPDQDGLLFLTIGSNEIYGEIITFKAYLSEQNTIVNLEQTIDFENLSVIGSLDEPYMFNLAQYLLTLITEPEEGGSVAGEGQYFENDIIEITTTSNEGWMFAGWSGDTEYVEDVDLETTTVTMPAKDINLVANFDFVSNVAEGLYHDVCVFPNPFNKSITVANTTGVRRISLLTLSGTPIDIKYLFGNQEATFYTSKLSSGLYLITIELESGQLITKKMVKK